MNRIKVLFLTQTTQIGPSSRYRVYQYLEFLKQNNFKIEVSPGLSENDYKSFYLSNDPKKKFFYLFKVFSQRIKDMLRVGKFDFVFIQREILPQMFPFFELIYSKINKNLIFDFDDAIYLIPPQRNNFIYKFRYRKALERILKVSRSVIVGNQHLNEFASRYNKSVTLIPTAVDIQSIKKNALAENLLEKDKIIIGWIGSVHTVFYLEIVRAALQKLSKRYNIVLHIIGADKLVITGVEVINKKWSLSTENSDLHLVDIGIAPLYDDAWGKGKCGLKALQYMSAGIACVCSDAGIYKEMIIDGVNGFLAKNTDDWVQKISSLIEDSNLRENLIKAALCQVKEKYLKENNKYKFLEIFQ